MSPARAAYTVIAYALLPVALVRLWLRGRREPAYRRNVAERLGRYPQPPTPGPHIWIHTVSVGETRAAEPLVRAILERFPDHRVLLTHMTPTGRATSEALFGERVLRAYVPYDYPGAVRRFLDHYEPRVGVLLETEIWPNLVHACKARGVPLFLVNARLSEKSSRGYARFAPLARQSFAALTAVAAQSADDAKRLQSLGAAPVTVMGNLKFDVTPAPALLDLGRTWRDALGRRRVLLAASTRDGEEALLLDALPELAPRALLVIVPRHPQRFDEVAALLASRGIAYRRRSAGFEVDDATRVVLGDSMGELTAYYAASDVAYVGGSLLPFGGQNLIEACAVGVPVIVGPHTYNFAEAAEKAVEAGAALRAADAGELVRTASNLLAEPETLSSMGARGLEFSRAHQGATERVMKLLAISAATGSPQRDRLR
jgi:3-deoxy-D-manno-octulosonic-acid transferase